MIFRIPELDTYIIKFSCMYFFFSVICHKLHQMNLIDLSYNVEEFEFMRSHYQRALFHLLTVAKSLTDASESETNVLPQFPR